MIISFVSIPIFARLLGPEEYGMVAIYIATLGIASPILSFALTFSVTRARIDFNNKLSEYVQSIFIFILLFWFGFSLIFYFFDFKKIVSDFLGISQLMLVLLLFDVILKTIIDLIVEFNRAEFKYKFVSVFLTLLQLSTFLLSYVAVDVLKILDLNAENRILGIVLVNLLFSSFILSRFFSKKTPSKNILSIEHVRYGLAFSLPIIFASVGHIINAQSDRIIIGYLIDNEAVGIYSLSYSIGSLLFIFSGTIHQAITPWVYQRYSDGEFQKVTDFFNIYICLSVTMISILLMVSPLVVDVIGGKEYIQARGIIPWIFMSGFFQIIITIETTVQMYNKSTGSYSKVVCLGALTNIILNLALIPLFGLISAAVTTFVTYALMFALLLFDNHRRDYQEKTVRFKTYSRSIFLVVTFYIVSVLCSDLEPYISLVTSAAIVIATTLFFYKDIRRVTSCL